jgi:hypothetical protein
MFSYENIDYDDVIEFSLEDCAPLEDPVLELDQDDIIVEEEPQLDLPPVEEVVFAPTPDEDETLPDPFPDLLDAFISMDADADDPIYEGSDLTKRESIMSILHFHEKNGLPKVLYSLSLILLLL